MKLRISLVCAALLALAFSVQGANVMTIAVFDFESKDEAVHDLGPKVASLINAQLSANPNVITVERAELEKALGEQELGLSGTIEPETTAKVGHLTGAKVLVTGRVFNVGRETMIVAKIIGTETSRVYGDVVRGTTGSASISDMSTDMAARIAKIVADKADTLVAKVEKPEDLIGRLQPQVQGKKLPTVSITIAERHIGTATIDPAAETEVGFILQKLGFAVTDKKDTTAKADIEITGEAFSEFGMRKGNLVSCKGRVELKATDKATGRVLFIDRQTTVAVDLSEHLAGKTALQDAAAKLTERLLPALLKP
ncbi:MAG: CsgG/HfaB family protein [Verrucomicrobiia bacterium]